MNQRCRIIGVLLSLVLAMSLALVGCGGGGGANANNGELHTVTAGVLTVGSDCDYPPFIEMNGDQPSGFEYDLLLAVADELGLELVYLPPQNFDTLIAAVAAGTRMDIGASSFTINDERRQLVDFSIPYFDSNQAVVALINSPYTSAMDLDGEIVGAQSGTTGADWVNEHLATATLKGFNQAAELMASLAAGGIEGAFLDEPVAAEYVATTYTTAHIVEVIPTGEQYGIAVSQDNPALLDAINAALRTLKQNGTFDEIFLRYFPDLTPPSLKV